MFRITTRQRRNLLIGTAIVTVAATGLSVAAAIGWGSGGTLGAYAIGAGIGALVSLYASLAYAIAFTECTAAGIRSRGLAGRRYCPWPQVRDISVRSRSMNSTVIVTTTSGTRFRLGAPVDGRVARDPEFWEKLLQIRNYWRTLQSPSDNPSTIERAGRGRDTGAIPVDAGPGKALKALLAITQPAALLSFALAFAVATFPFMVRDIGPAWSAHLGHGQPGIFTAYAENCSNTNFGTHCTWYGTFTGDNGSSRDGMLLASGGHIRQAGDQVPAIDTGDPKVVYPAGGGADWILITVIMALEIAAMIYVPVYLIRKFRRRAAARRRHEPLNGEAPVPKIGNIEVP